MGMKVEETDKSLAVKKNVDRKRAKEKSAADEG